MFTASSIPLKVVIPETLILSKFVCPSTSKSPLTSTPVAVTTPDEIIPFLAVINPTESTFLTSSYVNTPATNKSPVTFKSSSTIVVPLAESNVRLPADVVISLSASIPNLRLSI